MKNTNYKIITKKWLKKFASNNKVIEKNYFQTNDGKRFYADNKHVVLDYGLKEKKIANWLSNVFGCSVCINPRINYPEGIKTSDYIFKNEYWDLKAINGNSKQVLYHAIYDKKDQSKNFIFDLTNSTLSLKEGINQIKIIYSRTDMTFVDKIIIKKNQYFYVFKRK